MNKQQREEILRNDLSGLKVGDWAYQSAYGDCRIRSTCEAGGYPISTEHIGLACAYDLTGRSFDTQRVPTLFKSLNSCILFFQALKEQEEEASVWTWLKIKKAVNDGVINFGSIFEKIDPREGLDKASYLERFVFVRLCDDAIGYIELIDTLGCKAKMTHAASFRSFKAYDRAGNLIDPREY